MMFMVNPVKNASKVFIGSSALRGCLLVLWLLLGLAHGTPLKAQELQSRELEALAPVLDEIGVLDADSVKELKTAMSTIDARYGVRAGVVIVRTAEPDGIEALANGLGNQWKIGERPGFLLVLAIKDRNVRIEVSRDLEGALPDLYAHQVIQSHMLPQLSKGAYASALLEALEAIEERFSDIVSRSTSRHDRIMLPADQHMAAIIGWLVFFPGLGTLCCVVAGLEGIADLRRWWAFLYLLIIGGSSFLLIWLIGGTPKNAQIFGAVCGTVSAVLVWWYAARREPRLLALTAEYEKRSRELDELLMRVKAKRRGSVSDSASIDHRSGAFDDALGSNDHRSDDFAGGGSTGRW